MEDNREERQVENAGESVAVKNPSAEELERVVAMILAAVDGGRVLRADGRAALDQEEAALGLSPRSARPSRRKTGRTVEELYDTDFAEPKWVVHELLPVGLASLADRPKVGKSRLALQLAAAVATVRRFLDWEARWGMVLFIALKDPLRWLKERLAHLGVPRSAEVQFDTDWPLLNEGAQGLCDLQRCMVEWQPRLVVIDTLARAFDHRLRRDLWPAHGVELVERSQLWAGGAAAAGARARLLRTDAGPPQEARRAAGRDR